MSTLPAAFQAKTRMSTCLIWIGSTNSKGYGLLLVDGSAKLAHRIAYEAEYGPIPDGHVIDHLCRVRNCVRPEHLEAVTIAENNRRGRSVRRLAAGDTCINGHVLAPEDIYERPGGGSADCRHCRRLARRGALDNSPRVSADKVRTLTDAADAAVEAAS